MATTDLKFKSLTPFITDTKGVFLGILEDGSLVKVAWDGSSTGFTVTDACLDDQRKSDGRVTPARPPG